MSETVQPQIMLQATLDKSPLRTKIICFWEGGVVDEEHLVGKTFRIISNPERGVLMLEHIKPVMEQSTTEATDEEPSRDS